MANRSQPNAQNSELDPKKHPSGARIEKLLNGETTVDMNGEKGLYGETLRPSEREDSYVETPGAADAVNPATSANGDNHRRTPDTREQ